MPGNMCGIQLILITPRQSEDVLLPVPVPISVAFDIGAPRICFLENLVFYRDAPSFWNGSSFFLTP